MTACEILNELRGNKQPAEFARELGISRRMLDYVCMGKRRLGAKTLRGLLNRYPERKDELTEVFLSQNVNKGGGL